MFYSYKFGTALLKSDFEIPELEIAATQSKNKPILSCSKETRNLEKIEEWSHIWTLHNQPTLWYKKNNDQHIVRFNSDVELYYEEGSAHVLVRHSPGADESTIRHALIDQFLPRILNHLGSFVVHAGGIVSSTGSAIFIGESGWGKSTLTCELSKNEFSLLSDDCLVVEKSAEDNYYCVPSYPSMRLRPQSLSALYSVGGNASTVETSIVLQGSDKRRLSPAALVNKTAVDYGQLPLRAIFILDDPSNATTISVQPVTPLKAAMALVAQSFRLNLTDHQAAVGQLAQAGDLAAVVPAFSLSYPRDFTLFATVCDEVRTVLHEHLG